VSRCALLAAALLLPASAGAQPTASLRLAFAPAVGDVVDGVPMSDALRSQIPIQLDALWRFGRYAAGAYASWGPGQVGRSSCGSGADCSASALRFGAEGTYALLPVGAAGIVPWVGLGLGWERGSQRRERLGSRTAYAWSGLELALQGGLDWPVAGRYAIGPFVQLALGRYSDVSLETSSASASADIGARATHAWFHVGVRAKVDL